LELDCFVAEFIIKAAKTRWLLAHDGEHGRYI
jgi:hypothetical protein